MTSSTRTIIHASGLLLCILTLSLGSLQAQSLDAKFEHLGVRDGLSQSTAYSIFEDKLGFIWIGTDDGLNRYDGYEFMVFRNSPLNLKSLSNNSVNSIIEDNNGNLWVGTDQGLNLLDGSTGEFKVHRFDFHNPSSLSSNTVWCMALDGTGNLWVGTANGLNRYNHTDSTFTQFKQELNDQTSLSNNSINSLFRSSNGTLWIGSNQGLNRWDDAAMEFVRYPIPGDNSRYGQVVQCVSEDQDGGLLVGTNKGLFELVGGKLRACKGFSLPSRQVKSIQADGEGDLWIGTDNGLYQFRSGRRRPVMHQSNDQIVNGLNDDKITAIIEDSSGIIWIGTYSGGLSIYYREQQKIFHYDHTNFGRASFPSDIVNSVSEVLPGQYWIGTRGGIGVLKNNSMSEDLEITVPLELSRMNISKIRRQGSRIAIGTERNGFYVYDVIEKVNTYYGQNSEGTGLSDDRITDFELLGDEAWVGTQNGGVNIIDLYTDEVRTISYDPAVKDGLRDNRIIALELEGDKALWIGTASAGVQRLDLQTNSFTDYRVNEDTMHTLSNDKILSLAYQNDVVWVGTKGGGLNKIDLKTQTTIVYTTENGLANNVVHNIIYDEKGRLWMSTNLGVSVLDVENENFINYNDIDGLGNHGFRPGSGTLTSNGEIIFGGLQGLDIIRYEDIETNSVLPKVYFTEIEAFDSRANKYHPELSKKLIDKVDVINLPPEISLVTLGFSGLSYRKPEKNRYAYRLAGITDEWTFIEDRRYVTFSELPPGQYSLQVKAANNDGKWSEDPTEMTINVIPGFYQTRTFKALLALGLGLGVYFFYRYRVRRVTRRNKLLEERVRARTKQIEKERDEKAILLKEIHHRVKNNLQIVNSLLRLQSHYVKDEEALWALDESQNRVMSMAMIHERMYKTENLANINIPDYIRDLCTDIISTYDVTNSVTLDVNVEVEKLNLDTLTPLGLIINEISSNAMKYAFPDERTGTFKVHLSALDPGKRFKLVIGDDGVGMPHDLTNTEIESLGTILMESLSEQLNGTLKRMDGKGTMYEMIFEQIHT